MIAKFDHINGTAIYLSGEEIARMPKKEVEGALVYHNPNRHFRLVIAVDDKKPFEGDDFPINWEVKLDGSGIKIFIHSSFHKELQESGFGFGREIFGRYGIVLYDRSKHIHLENIARSLEEELEVIEC